MSFEPASCHSRRDAFAGLLRGLRLCGEAGLAFRAGHALRRALCRHATIVTISRLRGRGEALDPSALPLPEGLRGGASLKTGPSSLRASRPLISEVRLGRQVMTLATETWRGTTSCRQYGPGTRRDPWRRSTTTTRGASKATTSRIETSRAVWASCPSAGAAPRSTPQASSPRGR